MPSSGAAKDAYPRKGAGKLASASAVASLRVRLEQSPLSVGAHTPPPNHRAASATVPPPSASTPPPQAKLKHDLVALQRRVASDKRAQFLRDRGLDPVEAGVITATRAANAGEAPAMVMSVQDVLGEVRRLNSVNSGCEPDDREALDLQGMDLPVSDFMIVAHAISGAHNVRTVDLTGASLTPAHMRVLHEAVAKRTHAMDEVILDHDLPSGCSALAASVEAAIKQTRATEEARQRQRELARHAAHAAEKADRATAEKTFSEQCARQRRDLFGVERDARTKLQNTQRNEMATIRTCFRKVAEALQIIHKWRNRHRRLVTALRPCLDEEAQRRGELWELEWADRSQIVLRQHQHASAMIERRELHVRQVKWAAYSLSYELAKRARALRKHRERFERLRVEHEHRSLREQIVSERWSEFKDMHSDHLTRFDSLRRTQQSVWRAGIDDEDGADTGREGRRGGRSAAAAAGMKDKMDEMVRQKITILLAQETAARHAVVHAEGEEAHRRFFLMARLDAFVAVITAMRHAEAAREEFSSIFAVPPQLALFVPASATHPAAYHTGAPRRLPIGAGVKLSFDMPCGWEAAVAAAWWHWDSCHRRCLQAIDAGRPLVEKASSKLRTWQSGRPNATDAEADELEVLVEHAHNEWNSFASDMQARAHASAPPRFIAPGVDLRANDTNADDDAQHEEPVFFAHADKLREALRQVSERKASARQIVVVSRPSSQDAEADFTWPDTTQSTWDVTRPEDSKGCRAQSQNTSLTDDTHQVVRDLETTVNGIVVDHNGSPSDKPFDVEVRVQLTLDHLRFDDFVDLETCVKSVEGITETVLEQSISVSYCIFEPGVLLGSEDTVTYRPSSDGESMAPSVLLHPAVQLHARPCLRSVAQPQSDDIPHIVSAERHDARVRTQAAPAKTTQSARPRRRSVASMGVHATTLTPLSTSPLAAMRRDTRHHVLECCDRPTTEPMLDAATLTWILYPSEDGDTLRIDGGDGVHVNGTTLSVDGSEATASIGTLTRLVRVPGSKDHTRVQLLTVTFTDVIPIASLQAVARRIAFRVVSPSPSPQMRSVVLRFSYRTPSTAGTSLEPPLGCDDIVDFVMTAKLFDCSDDEARDLSRVLAIDPRFAAAGSKAPRRAMAESLGRSGSLRFDDSAETEHVAHSPVIPSYSRVHVSVTPVDAPSRWSFGNEGVLTWLLPASGQSAALENLAPRPIALSRACTVRDPDTEEFDGGSFVARIERGTKGASLQLDLPVAAERDNETGDEVRLANDDADNVTKQLGFLHFRRTDFGNGDEVQRDVYLGEHAVAQVTCTMQDFDADTEFSAFRRPPRRCVDMRVDLQRNPDAQPWNISQLTSLIRVMQFVDYSVELPTDRTSVDMKLTIGSTVRRKRSIAAIRSDSPPTSPCQNEPLRHRVEVQHVSVPLLRGSHEVQYPKCGGDVSFCDADAAEVGDTVDAIAHRCTITAAVHAADCEDLDALKLDLPEDYVFKQSADGDVPLPRCSETYDVLQSKLAQGRRAAHAAREEGFPQALDDEAALVRIENTREHKTFVAREVHRQALRRCGQPLEKGAVNVFEVWRASGSPSSSATPFAFVSVVRGGQLCVWFNEGATVTANTLAVFLNSLRYASTDRNPHILTKHLVVELSDGDNGSSVAWQSIVRVLPTEDPPELIHKYSTPLPYRIRTTEREPWTKGTGKLASRFRDRFKELHFPAKCFPESSLDVLNTAQPPAEPGTVFERTEVKPTARRFDGKLPLCAPQFVQLHDQDTEFFDGGSITLRCTSGWHESCEIVFLDSEEQRVLDEFEPDLSTQMVALVDTTGNITITTSESDPVMVGVVEHVETTRVSQPDPAAEPLNDDSAPDTTSEASAVADAVDEPREILRIQLTRRRGDALEPFCTSINAVRQVLRTIALRADDKVVQLRAARQQRFTLSVSDGQSNMGEVALTVELAPPLISVPLDDSANAPLIALWRQQCAAAGLAAPPVNLVLAYSTRSQSAATGGEAVFPTALVNTSERDKLSAGAFMEVFISQGYQPKDAVSLKLSGTQFVATSDGFIIYGREGAFGRLFSMPQYVRVDVVQPSKAATAKRLQQLLRCIHFKIDPENRDAAIAPGDRTLTVVIGEGKTDLLGRPAASAYQFTVTVQDLPIRRD